jgi:uncharacterized protein YecE (DUF72 family)
LNATHYKLFKPEEIQAWKAKVSLHSDFLFCPKVYNAITHVGTLRDKKFLTDVFLDSLTYFGNNLGPIFLQMSDKFGPQRKDELVTYLRTLPKNYQFFLEIRHPEWFDVRSKNIFSALQDLNIGTVITDAAGRRDVVHMHLTIPKVMIRYIGNNGHPTDYKRLSEWVERIMYWKESGLREVYFFVHSVDEAFSPELSYYMIQELNDKCKLFSSMILPITSINSLSTNPSRASVVQYKSSLRKTLKLLQFEGLNKWTRNCPSFTSYCSC